MPLSKRCRSGMNVGHHRGLGDTWIDDDEFARLGSGDRSTRWQRMGWLSSMLAPMWRMTSADSICVGAGWAVGAEGEVVAGDGGGHAEGCVAVVVAGAKAELDEFAEGIELFREKSAGADDAERLVAVALLNIEEAMDHGAEGFVPADGSEHVVFTKGSCLAGPV
jgi:hypothetical protein